MGIKKNKGRILTIVTVLSLILTLMITGCAQTPQAPAKPEQINITYVKSPLNVPSIVEKNQQMFEKEFGKDGIKVGFPEITAGSNQTQALAAGSLDFCNALGGTSAILAAANGVDLKIISIYSRAPKAFMIVTKSPNIKSIADLKGKKAAGPKGTVLHQLLITALTKNNLQPDDVEYITMDQPGAVSALLNGSIDAALVAGGEASRAINAGARVITTGEGLVEGTIVVAVRSDFLKNHPDLVKRFQQVQQASLAYMKDNPQQAYALAAAELGISAEEVEKMIAWYDFDPTIKPSDLQELKNTQDFLFDNKLLEKKINIEDMIVYPN